MQAITQLRNLRRNRKLLASGNAAAASGNHAEAEQHYREYLAHVPDDPKVLFNLGALRQRALKDEKDQAIIQRLSAEAVTYYCDAVASQYPDPETKADCLNNQGLIFVRQGHAETAKVCFHLAMQLNPNHRAARLNFADVLVFEGEYEAANREFFEVINSDPNSAGALFCRSMIQLLTGDLKQGFLEYRSRFNVPAFPSKMLATTKPLWNGESLDGKTLIITQEQGWGDAIQFIRYAGEIKKAWPKSRVLFSVADSLHSLMRGVVGLDGCLPDHLTPEFVAPEFDYHAPLLHLPDIMGTTLETIPAGVPYIIPQAEWLPMDISLRAGTNNIGLCWAGSPIHGKDKWRSMKPEQFQRFIDAAYNAKFYSLQCGPRAHESELLSPCVNLPKDIHDWTQTANAILQMDLVITVDTAIAHLAGALGKPCWILLPSSPDWRWMLGRDDSPWYPDAVLWRQEKRDDWDAVIQQVCEALK